MTPVRVGYHSVVRSSLHQIMPRAVTMLILLFIVGSVFGCQRRLFPKDSPRTQFETYDRMRQKFVPLEQLDVFGEPKPALRARLGSS